MGSGHLAMLVVGAGTDLEARTQPSGHWQDSHSAEAVGAQWTEMMPTEMSMVRSGTWNLRSRVFRKTWVG